MKENFYPLKNIKKLLDKFRPFFKKIVLPVYWAFLTYMLLKPGEENQEYWFMFPGIDKLIHLSIFAFLGFSLLMSFKKLNLTYFLGIIFVYGLGTEILQEVMHMGRTFELLDILADLVGGSLGFITYRVLLRFLPS